MKKQLFELLNNKGEGIFNKVHIIFDPFVGIDRFRVYHSDGYCFDCERVDELDYYEYVFFTGYEGFKPITIEEAIKLIKEI